MSEQDHIGKGFLKERLGEFRADPPEEMWTVISGRLGNRNRKRIVFFAISAAATIALAVTLGIGFFRSGPDDRTVSEASVQTETGAQEGAVPETEASAKAEGVPQIENGAQLEAARETGPAAQPETLAKTQDGAQPEGAVQAETVTQTEAVAQIGPGTHAEAARETGPAAQPETLAKTQDGAQPEGAVQGLLVPVGRLQPEDVQALNRISPDLDPALPGIREWSGYNLTALPVDTLIPSRLTPDEQYLFADTRETDRESRGPRWTVGAALSPIYSFRDAEGQSLAASGDYESGIISYAGGVQVGYRAASRLAVESGILFNKMGISIGSQGILMYEQAFDFAPLREEAGGSNILAVNNSVGNIVSPSGDIYVNSYKVQEFNEANAYNQTDQQPGIYLEQEIRQQLDYLELPFNLRYSVIDSDIEIQLVGGMSTNFLLNSSVIMETATGEREIGYLTNIKTINYSGNAGIGMVYHVQDRFSLRLEPRFRYYINSINDQTLPSTRPYTFGIYTGLNFRF